MQLEASALTAILLNEADAEIYARRIWGSVETHIPIVSAFEAALAIGIRKKNYDGAMRAVVAYLDGAGVAIQACPDDLLPDLMQAYARYGKKTGHPAKLNLGDCFSYVMARRSGASLLFKGDDFPQTDIQSAL